MSEHDDEREVARRYRELPREEPRPELDARIRAAARSAAEMHPAPLVPPTGRRRWYFPVAAAAVIVLAVAVTWHVERDESELVVATVPESALKKEQAAQVPQSVPEPEVAPQPERRLSTPAPKPKVNVPAAEMPAEPAAPPLAQSSDRAASETVTGAVTSRADSAPRPAAAAGARAPVDPRPLATLGLDEAPVPWLQRIAELRRQGKDEEADRELAEFRKRYPDYVIPPAMLEKVEKK